MGRDPVNEKSSLQSGVLQMNDTIHCSRSTSAWCWKSGAVFSLMLWCSLTPVGAQGPAVAPVYSNQPPASYPPPGSVGGMPLPTRPQYYEMLPEDRFSRAESPLDRFLKQSIKQTYGRFDYLNWNISNPGEGVIGGPGKKLLDGEGFQTPSYIDPIRGPEQFDFGDEYPIRNPLLVNYNNALVLIQTWESNPDELLDLDSDGNIYDVVDADLDGINDDDNDLDIFPRITNQAKSDMLSGLDTDILFSTGDPTANPIDPAQVAVLGIGQLANSNAFHLDNNNGFRGVVGLHTSFGGLETGFFVLDRARSGFQFQAISTGLIGVPNEGGLLNPSDPLVIPVLVNDQMAPDVLDANGNVVTDSNNYYIIFNDSYSVAYESEAWGFNPQAVLDLYERPDRIRLSGLVGFRYFDFREQMLQTGSFSNDDAVADLTYDNEVNEDFTSTIDSTTLNRVYGPEAGLRAEIGDERLSFGVDAKVMLGANTHEAVVAVNDLLYVGDDNYTKESSTHFSTGFDLLVDARMRVANHVSLTVGYNFLWFNAITRPHDNIYYNIDATRIDAPDEGGPDYTYQNDVVVDKKKSSVSLSGLSVGLLIDW